MVWDKGEIKSGMEIGQVLRASTEGFTCGTRSSELRYPSFGAFVRTTDVEGHAVLGVIIAIRIDDDPLVRQLIMASDVNPAAIRDQRENRMIPVEIDVLNVGYVMNGELVFHTTPPRPPMSLDTVYLCQPDEVDFFIEASEEIGFLRLILGAGGIPNTVELLAAVVRNAANAVPEHKRYDFLVKAGHQIAKLMSHDPQSLQHVLTLIRPA